MKKVGGDGEGKDQVASAPCSRDSRRRERTRLRLSGCSCWRCSRGWCIPAGTRGAAEQPGMSNRQIVHGPGVQDAARRALENLFIATVAFLSVLQIAIATALPAVHGSGVGHVEEALSTAGGQVAPQLPQVAAVEHAREWVPEDRGGREAELMLDQQPSTARLGARAAVGVLYPVAAAMMQPPSSALAWQQSFTSWLMPKLWPISCAMVAATPTADSEWSC